MGKGGYNGGSSVVSRSGWILRPGQPAIRDAPSAPKVPEPKEVVKARSSAAKAIRVARATDALELAIRAAALLRADGVSEPEIRKRLKLKRKSK